MDGGSKPGPGTARDEWGYSTRIGQAGEGFVLYPAGWGGPPAAGPPAAGQVAQPAAREQHKDQGKDQGKAGSGPQKESGNDVAKGTDNDKPPMPRWKKLVYWIVGLLILLTLVTIGVLYWLDARHYETTDDAFIDGNLSQIASQVSGRVARIAFVDNQQVKAGQVLVELDPRDFQVKLDQAVAQRQQAAAQSEQSRAQLGLQQANLDQAQANVRVTEADLQQAQMDLARYRAVDPKAITRQQLDTSSSTVKSAAARLDASRQAVAGARAQIEAQRAALQAGEASLAQADVGVRNAQLQLSYTAIRAPSDGQVTKRTVELGNYISPGQSLLAVVQPRLWVTANFKETQLAAMREGQYVRVRVDACPGVDLNAKVTSFQAGSGQVFSSLPSENATGNYVKVVQRLPVRINFEEQDLSRCHMAPGMSVAPRVTVR